MTQGIARDFKLAARRLLATPLFTIFAVLSLAVGVGVTTSVYSVVNSLFWRDLGVSDPGHALFVMAPSNGRVVRAALSRPDYDDLRAAQKSFASFAAGRRVSLAATLPAKTDLLTAEAVDGEYFRTLGVRTSLGRTIETRDDAIAANVVVLSHALWRKAFQGAPGVVGQTLRLSGHPFEIIGVAQKPFEGPGARFGPFGTSMWVPLSTAPMFVPPAARPSKTPLRDQRILQVVGRLRPGVTVESAAAEISTIAASLDVSQPQHSEYALRSNAPRQWTARPLGAIVELETEFVNHFGLLLIGLVGLVLVVACTNLSNLVLARGIIRHQEFAIRRALGASRARLVREQAAESFLIALAGAVASYIVLQLLRTWMTTDFPMDQRWTLSIEPVIDLRALAVAACAVLLSLLVFGLEPALALTRSRDVNADLAEGRGSVGVPKANRQRTLLRWQVAISAGFFIIATMCVKYTVEEIGHDSGVDMDALAVAAVNPYTQGWNEERTRLELDRTVQQGSRQSGVESIAVSTGLPFGTAMNPHAMLSTPENPAPEPGKGYDARVVAATPQIFRTLGVPILQGRGFDDRDDAGSLPVIVLTETAAKAMFGTTEAVGRQVTAVMNALGGNQPAAPRTVIGIAGDTDERYLSERRSATVYVPFAQQYHPFVTVTVRARGGSAAAIAALQKAIRTASPDMAIQSIGSGRTILAGPFAFLRAVGLLAIGLGGLTLLLAMVGLFGIQSHTVAYRTREIGVRMTFGATAAQIKRMVLKDGYKPVLQGLAIGVFIGFTGRAIIRSYMEVDISIFDPWMFFVVPIPLCLAAFCACYLPARRASRVDPQVALRHL